MTQDKPIAVIVGVGSGLSAALARRLAPTHRLVLAARKQESLAALQTELDAQAVTLDAKDPAAVAQMFEALPEAPRVAIYNPSARVRGPIAELGPEKVRHGIEVTAFGAFLTGQAAAKRMLQADPVQGTRGTILFTGASAGVKGFPNSAPFAMGKFAQRGLAQSMARELHPKGIHVAWVNIDGAIRSHTRVEPEDAPDSMLDPDAVAEAYMALIAQPRSAWSDEVTVRPWVERF